MPCAVDFGNTSSRPSTASFLSVRHLLLEVLHHRAEQPDIGRQRPEQIAEVLVEHGLGRCRAGDDRGLVARRDGGDDLGVPRPERGQQEIDLVVGDELFGELGGALAVRLVIVLDQLDLRLGAADIDAAGGIDLLKPHLPDQFLLLGFVRDGPGQRQRRADLDVRGLRGRRRQRPLPQDPRRGSAHRNI